MDFNSTLDSIINNVNTNQTTLRSLLAQLQHTTITSSDDELYDAPTLDDETGIWTLAQSTANVGGLYVGCYKLPDDAINSYITNVNVVTYNAPSFPTAPASITEAGESPVDLTDVLDLEGQSFNSFCIRSTVAFEITLDIIETNLCTKTPIFWQAIAGDDGYIEHLSGCSYRGHSSSTVTASGKYYISIAWQETSASPDFSVVGHLASYSDTASGRIDSTRTEAGGSVPFSPADWSHDFWVLQVGSDVPFTIDFTVAT